MPFLPDGGAYIHRVDTPADLPHTASLGFLTAVLNPPGLYLLTSTGWQLVATPSGSQIPPVPASESGQGIVELATEAEVQAGTAGILVATVARLKAEFDRRAGAASEAAQGVVEHATEAEVQAGTAGNLVATAARLKAELDRRINPEAWIAPSLVNGWSNFGGVTQAAGYRKTPTGEVQLRGLIKDGTITEGTTLFTLPSGYRPAAQRSFPAIHGGNNVCRITVESTGEVVIRGGTNNAFLSLEPVRFDV
jgi:hypothetical protein